MATNTVQQTASTHPAATPDGKAKSFLIFPAAILRQTKRPPKTRKTIDPIRINEN
jgi:hypothetical protein